MPFWTEKIDIIATLFYKLKFDDLSIRDNEWYLVSAKCKIW